jgi:hypothetical protein
VGRKKRDEEEREVRSSSWNSNLCLETLSDLSGQRISDEGIQAVREVLKRTKAAEE